MSDEPRYRSSVSPVEGESHKDYTVGYIRNYKEGGKLRRPGKEGMSMLKLTETIDLSFSSQLSAACYPTCDNMFDVEFKVGLNLQIALTFTLRRLGLL